MTRGGVTPALLDIVAGGAFIYERADGSRYATWTNMERFGVQHVARSGALTAEDLQRPSSEVLAAINQALAQPSSTPPEVSS